MEGVLVRWQRMRDGLDEGLGEVREYTVVFASDSGYGLVGRKWW